MKLIYLISRVFLTWTLLNFLAHCGIFFEKKIKKFLENNSYYFVSGETKASTWSSWSISQNRGIRNARKRFLELACQGSVQSIHVVSDSETDTTEYKKWSELIGILAIHWNMVDRLSEVRIVSMYKGGYDSLGKFILVSRSYLFTFFYTTII